MVGRYAGGPRRAPVLVLFAVIAIAIATVAIVALLVSIHALQDSRAARASLLADGSDATATITAVSKPGGEVCGVVEIQFTDGSGRAVTVADVQVQPPARQGDEFRIRYDRSDPTHLEVVDGCGDPRGEWRYWLTATASVLLLVVEVALIATWLVVVRNRTRRDASVVSS